MPWIDRLAVGRGLAAYAVEACAPGPSRGERVAGERRIEAGEGAGRMLESGSQRQRQAVRAGQPVLAHHDDDPQSRESNKCLNHWCISVSAGRRQN